MEFTVGKFGLKLCRQREGEWLSVIGKTHKIRASRDDNGYWVYTFNVPTPNVEQLNDEAIRERAANVIRQLSPLGFLNQKYPNAIGGNLGQLEQFIADFVTAGWPETSSVAANTLANGIRRIILGECEIVECERKESPVIQAIEGATGVPRNWVPLLRPTATVDEAKAVAEAKTVKTSDGLKWNPAPHNPKEIAEITFTPQALDLCKQGGQIMGIDADGHHTLKWDGDTGHFVIRVYSGPPRDDAPSVAKSFEQLIAEVGGWEPPQATFDAEAATLNDGADEEISVWLALQYVAPHVSRAGEAAWNKLRTAIDVADSRAQKPWRLPTLEECAGDPEAMRVWTAANKPAREWHKIADGLPPITGEGDSRSESEHRFLWVKYDDDSWPVTSKAHVIHSRCRIGGRTPVLWAEIEPAPPLPPKLSNAELHNLYE